jgi:hypothetical protein
VAKASDLDPHYWEPRFERAEYLTYYPESEEDAGSDRLARGPRHALQGGSSSTSAEIEKDGTLHVAATLGARSAEIRVASAPVKK